MEKIIVQEILNIQDPENLSITIIRKGKHKYEQHRTHFRNAFRQ